MLTNEKDPRAGNTGPFENHTLDTLNCALPCADSKALATLKAQFAIAGHQVYEGSNDDFIVTRWGMSRYCENLAGLQAFAKQLGVMP